MNIIEMLKVIFFGIVEGITEWLPISSTGHMIILNEWLHLDADLGTSLYDLFIYVIQFGAICAVIVEFFKKLWPFGKQKIQEEKKKTWLMLLNIVIGCLPAGIIGVLLNDKVDEYLLNLLTVSITLIVYGFIFIAVEVYLKRTDKEFTITDVKELTWKTALIIGCAQVLSIIPGTSRSGVTIIAALLIGCDRKTAAEFSFFLSIPVMLGVSLYKGARFAISGHSLSLAEGGYILIGCIVAFVVSIFVIKFFMKLIKTKTFIGFGYYRIAFGTFLLIMYFTVLKNMPDASNSVAWIEAGISYIRTVKFPLIRI